MSKISLAPNISGTGTLTISAPNTNTDRAIALPDAAGTVFVSGQALSATTGSFSGTVSGGSTIGVGGATPAASGAGITFPATQNPSSNANTLDDYEEGTWQPQLNDGTGTFQNIGFGTYIKVGGMVYAGISAYNFSFGSLGTGHLRVANLPFTAVAVSDSVLIGTVTGDKPILAQNGGDTTALLYATASGGIGINALTKNQFLNTTVGSLWGTFVYRAA